MFCLASLAFVFALASCTKAVSTETLAACERLHAQRSNQLVWDPFGPKGLTTISNVKLYHYANSDYWNAENSLNRPACIFFPYGAQDVSFAVTILNIFPSVDFALKSGGHNGNLGFSSVDEGIMIAFRPNSQFVHPAPDGETVDVGSGSKWEDVYRALEPLGKTVVGGRFGDVGVTGLALGGGFSYLSAQHGFTCDNIVNFECVLADGTIANANTTSHPDLYFSLRGGGNQFAIVTKMTMKTYDSGIDGQVWGGVRTYAGVQHPDVLEAVAKFTAGNNDPKAAIIPTFNFITLAGLNLPAIVVVFFYDGPSPPKGVFGDFDAIEPGLDNTRTRTFESLTRELLAGNYKGLRFNIAVNTFPNMPAENMTSFLQEHFELVRAASLKAGVLDLLDFKSFSFAVQPMSHDIVRASQNTGGGNALGMEVEHGDRVWIEYDLSWASRNCDGGCLRLLKNMVKEAHNLHATKYAGIYPTHYESGDLEYLSYNPIFMNDAMHGQNVLGSYGNNSFRRLRAAKARYDPNSFFSARQGGFKFAS